LLTTTDGSTSTRNTFFVYENGSWKHRFGPEEYDLLASAGTATASAGASVSPSSTPSPSPSDGELDCSDFDTQEQAQQAYDWDTSDPYGLDGAPGKKYTGKQGVACEGLP